MNVGDDCRQEVTRYAVYAIWDSIQMILSANYVGVSFLLMYGTMWTFDLRFDTYFFAIAYCVLAFMRFYVVEFFANGIHDLAHFLTARKRIQVGTDRSPLTG
jgi:hypothetical protein